MRNWLRRWLLTNADFVKLTRRVGEDEILEVSFNSTDPAATIQRTGEWLDFLIGRMEDHNKKVLTVVETIGGAAPKPHRVK